MKEDLFHQKAFFDKKIIGIGFDLSLINATCGRDVLLKFQITLIYFRYWIIIYKK